jgi:hypothetical protein
MKRYISLFICIVLIAAFVVKHSGAQEKVQQVLDIACIAKDVSSFKDCVQKIQDGQTDFIKITDMITCQSQDDCAVRLSNIKRTVLIYGATNTGSGFKRVNNFNYAIFTLQDSQNISIGGFLIDDSSEPSCPVGTVCPPAILVQNSEKILIESLNTKSVKNTAVMIQGSKNTIIRKSFFDDSETHAIEIQTSADTKIESNTVKNTQSNGVTFSSLGQNSITGNTFIHNNRAIYSTNCGSTCIGGQLQIMPGTGTVLVRKNIIQDGTIDVYGGFGLTASGIEIAGQNIDSVTLSCNTIVNNSGNGVVQTNRDASFKSVQLLQNIFTQNGIDVNIPFAASDKNEGNCYQVGCRVDGC